MGRYLQFIARSHLNLFPFNYKFSFLIKRRIENVFKRYQIAVSWGLWILCFIALLLVEEVDGRLQNLSHQEDELWSTVRFKQKNILA